MRVLITGGAGFLGANLAARLLKECDAVTILDNFSRPGSKQNAEWLSALGVKIVENDIREKAGFDPEQFDCIFHLAGQVTVTESVERPYEDFEHNVIGTLNILEAVRKSQSKPKIVFSSTNKVYGHIADAHPITEDQPLDLLSPYGCSKGAADQYVLDYGRTYHLRTVVLRQSCIYGERQYGMLGQGWISWFANRILSGDAITIFGDGKQVRDILYVEDWVNVACLAAKNGEGVFNVGGGPTNAVSIIDAMTLLEHIAGKVVEKRFDKPRVSDQEYYVSDISKAKRVLGWEPTVNIDDGLKRLVEWTKQTI